MIKLFNPTKIRKFLYLGSLPSHYHIANLFDLDEEKIDLNISPQKCLFSSLIEYESPNVNQIQVIEKESKLAINNNSKLTENKLTRRIAEFQLKKKDYLDFMQNSPNGRVNIFNYKDTKFTLVGAQYEFIPIKNIFKILNYSKPDLVLLQVKPDQVMKKFKILLKKEKNNKFSSLKYFSQCLRRPEEVMPDDEYRQKVSKHLQENNVFISEEKVKSNEEKTYKPYKIMDRISMDAIATASFYCELHKIPIVLCDIPEIVFRQSFSNSKTLMQIQNIFTKCCRDLALYPDYQPQTPLNMGYYEYPELFLEKSDKYISTLIEYLLRPKGFKGKNIVGLLGYGQSDSVAAYLNNRKTSHFDFELTSSEPQSSFIRDITGEEILEKHAIMDVMKYGSNILQEFDTIDFSTSFKIIEKYADPLKVNSSRFKEFRILHYEFLKKYQYFCETEFEEGKKLLRREFLKQTRLI